MSIGCEQTGHLAAIGRDTIGVVMLLAGVMKASEPTASGDVIAFVLSMEAPASSALARMLGVIEVVLGGLLLAGISVVPTASSTALLLSLFSAILLHLQRRGRKEGCGCFGTFEAGAIGYPQHLRNGFLLTGLILLIWRENISCEAASSYSEVAPLDALAGVGIAIVAGLLYKVLLVAYQLNADNARRSN